MAKDETQRQYVGRAGEDIVPEERVKILFSGPEVTVVQFTKFMLDKPLAATPRPALRERSKSE